MRVARRSTRELSRRREALTWGEGGWMTDSVKATALGDSLGFDDIDVDLTPGIGLLGALKGLRYNEWFALAEYVDNSLSSYLRDIDAISAVHKDKVAPQLVVSVKQSPDRLIIRDNAG